MAVSAMVAAALTVGTPNARAATATESAAATSVFTLLNAERTAHKLPKLGVSLALATSAHNHNLAMAKANLLSHQLPGEHSLSQRISAVGVAWRYIAENVAWTTNRTITGASAVHAAMYGERPPNDGHRRNILSTSARYVGIDVIIDSATGRLWLTEDFADAAGPVPAAHKTVGHLNSATSAGNHRAQPPVRYAVSSRGPSNSDER